MIESIKHFGKFCIFKGTPADVDGSTRTLVVLIFIYWLVMFGIGSLVSLRLSGKYWSLADEAVSQLNLVFKYATIIFGIFVVLDYHSARHKFRKTLSSYFGASIIIALVMLVYIVIESELFGESQEYSFQIGPLIIDFHFVFFLFLVWLASVFGYILSKTTGVKFWQCGLLAFFLICASEILSNFFEIISRSILSLVSFGRL